MSHDRTVAPRVDPRLRGDDIRGLVVPAALALLGALALAACGDGDEPDAYGNFEATAVVVGSETAGRLTHFAATEGVRLPAGALVAVIDTTPLVLQLEQIAAQRAAGASRGAEVGQQEQVLAVQRRVAERTYERTRRLFAERAATAQQLDQAERDYRTLVAQIAAARTQRRTVAQDVASTDARAAQLRDQLRRARVANPVGGTVLTTYARAGEYVQPGQPLYRVASLDTLELRAYVPETQLARIRLGQAAEVSVDAGETRQRFAGQVAWISSEAEFTPTPVQTREERASLVYAVKVRVPNERGALKIGMPADVRFAAAAGAP